MTAGVDFLLRPAVPSDHRQLTNLMHFSPYVHRHLDWRYPLDWIGASPFFVLENDGQISAALACIREVRVYHPRAEDETGATALSHAGRGASVPIIALVRRSARP